MITVIRGDCLRVLSVLPVGSINLAVKDITWIEDHPIPGMLVVKED